MSVVQIVSTPYEPNPKYINSFSYSVHSLILSQEITFNVVLYDQNNSPLCVKQVTMSGADYANWGSDDDYVVHFICSQLGLTSVSNISVPEPTPIEPSQPTEPVVEPTAPTNQVDFIENVPVIVP